MVSLLMILVSLQRLSVNIIIKPITIHTSVDIKMIDFSSNSNWALVDVDIKSEMFVELFMDFQINDQKVIWIIMCLSERWGRYPSPQLTRLFLKSFSNCTIPSELKKSVILPIKKQPTLIDV